MDSVHELPAKLVKEILTGELQSINQPLLNIPLHHIVLDELHLLRINDVLLANLIEDAMEWDDREDKERGAQGRSLRKSDRSDKQLWHNILSVGKW